MADITMKPCHFCGKRTEQPHTYPKYDNGTVYGCLLVHNCESGVKIQVVSSKCYKSKEEAFDVPDVLVTNVQDFVRDIK